MPRVMIVGKSLGRLLSLQKQRTSVYYPANIPQRNWVPSVGNQLELKECVMGLRILATTVIFLISMPARAQQKWYKFDKNFIQTHYATDEGAIGILKVSAMHPAKNAHKTDCGGNDGELHIGVAAADLGRRPASSFAQSGDSGFGIVAEPPNVKNGSSFHKQIEGADGSAATFYGYFRVWNEGHDVGPIFPSNPHHVLEVHPAWGIRSSGFNYAPRPAVIFPMSGYSGYGASKFRPMLGALSSWLRVAEDARFVYVQMAKEDNFYQLPVTVKRTRTFANDAGVAALVDVFSDTAHQNLVYKDLTVITAANSRIATQLHPDWQTYLLGFFSINLRKAMEIAAGHSGSANAVPAPGALEFFAFGVPLQPAVSASKPCTEEDD